MNRQLWLWVSLVFWMLLTGRVAADSITPAADGIGTQVQRLGNRYDITGGHQAGRNLFHSFHLFNVGSGEIANFLAQPALRNILARVTGGFPSQVHGVIQITGGQPNLYLMNPAGILFGPQATLNVPAAFIATTANRLVFPGGSFPAYGPADLSQLTGDPLGLAFDGKNPAAVINEGKLTINPGQSIGLVGGQVIQTGTIQAPGGTITIAAVPGENLVRLSLPRQILSLELPPQQLAKALDAEGALPSVRLPELLTGVQTFTVHPDNTLQVSGAETRIPVKSATAVVAGQVDVSSNQGTGGRVGITGQQIALVKSEIDASGATGGGQVWVGGDFQGKGPFPRAAYTFISQDTHLRADATGKGRGGQVIVWADKATDFRGVITAKGGPQGGDGGLVEVSGKQTLRFTGRVETMASQGRPGTLLLDPETLRVVAGRGPDDAELADNQILFEDGPGATFTIGAATLLEQLRVNDVKLAAGNIRFETDLVGSSQLPTNFFAQAERSIEAVGNIVLANVGVALAGEQIAINNITARDVFLATASGIKTGDIQADSNAFIGTLKGSVVTGNITAGSEVNLFSNEGSITTGNINAGSKVFLGEGDIATGNIKAGSEVNLFSNEGSITTGNIKAGSDVLLLATKGSVNIGNITAGSEVNLFSNEGSITTGNINAGSKVFLGKGDIATGNIKAGSDVLLFATKGSVNSGNISIVATDVISVGNIQSNSSAFLFSNKGVQTGSINSGADTRVSAQGSIQTGDIRTGLKVSVTSDGGDITTGEIRAGLDTNLFSDGSIKTGNITAEGSSSLVAKSDIVAGNINTNLDAILRSSQAGITTGSIDARGKLGIQAKSEIKTRDIKAGLSAILFSESSVQIGNIQSSSDIRIVTAGGSITTGRVDAGSMVFLNGETRITTSDISALSDIVISSAQGDIATGNIIGESIFISTISGDIKTGDLNAQLQIGLFSTQGSVTTGNVGVEEGQLVILANTGVKANDINIKSDSAILYSRGSIETQNIKAAGLSYIRGRDKITTGDINTDRNITVFSGDFVLYLVEDRDFGLLEFSGRGGDIQTGNLTANGTIRVATGGGKVETGNLTSNGLIYVFAPNSIKTGFIDSSVPAASGGDVWLVSKGPIRVRDVGPTGFSINTNGGNVLVLYEGANSFVVGSASVNRTAGGVTTGELSILPTQQIRSRQFEARGSGALRVGRFSEENRLPSNRSISVFDIRDFDIAVGLIELASVLERLEIRRRNLGQIRLSDIDIRVPTIPAVENQLATAQTSDVAFNILGTFLEDLKAGNYAAIVSLDNLFTNEFSRALGVQPINNLNSVESIGDTLSRLAQETGKRPAVVYVMADDQQLTVAAITSATRLGQPGQGASATFPIIRGIPEARRSELMPVVERFVNTLRDPRQRTSDAYLQDAQRLYRWLIAPIESELQARGINTLLFVLDSGLRLLPLAALHDGRQFLVEKYSFSLIPSVNLVDLRYRNLRAAQVLAMGADTFATQPPLPAVPVELRLITQLWPGQAFLNQDFTVERLTQERLQRQYAIVHLATHADFVPGRPENSYIEFGNNQRLPLPRLRQLPLRQPEPVELFTLSACRTAVGDINSELGFAGLAVQAGVKSALASLWYVSDEGTLALMSEFYRNLQQAPIKAEALRQGQIALLRGQVTLKGGELQGPQGAVSVPPVVAQLGNQLLNHPYYWAGFTLVGSPW
ncbi:MAG: CHAT domain-containing protein [Gloeomargarita sp. SKYBB_i_bin120]|nr:CHAT domain-containing protein [Gloeomargarita sp. SKYG98]MCS7292793.1 CHAT domain-containing protein [Gloeomargarita sp. SKYB120]MDW8178356.1 CHAT domain-containing protein [Gloeomargarita sp. SKYBB_i_bin120]